MSEPRFTPGPWIFYADLPSTEPNWNIVTPANKMRVLANVHIEPGNAMDLANVSLIASAPDLFEALSLFVGDGNRKYTEIERQDIARAALAKALGEGL